MIRACSASQLSTCVKAATYSADLLSQMQSRSPEPVESAKGQDLFIANALMLATPVVVSAHLSKQAGDTQLPEMHLSFVGTSLRAISRLIARHISATWLPSAAELQAGPAGGAAVAGDGLLGDCWVLVMKLACGLAWEALHLRHSTNARIGGLEDIHSISASLIQLGLGAGGQTGKEL